MARNRIEISLFDFRMVDGSVRENASFVFAVCDHGSMPSESRDGVELEAVVDDRSGVIPIEYVSQGAIDEAYSRASEELCGAGRD
jgi:hypothetical protein